MRGNNDKFNLATQLAALARQKHFCASCGAKISNLGGAGQGAHRFGEFAHAHHMRHVKFGGTNLLNNCVILCQSCHYSAHEGGNYRFGKIEGRKEDFPYLHGATSGRE